MDFLKILKRMTEADDLKYSDICVMAVLVTYAQYQNEHTVTMSALDIHDEFKRISIPTIKRSLKSLQDNNYIEAIREKGQKNKYKILIELPPIESPPRRKQPTKAQAEQFDVSKYQFVINNFEIEEHDKK